jgi:hypothetical protein
LGTRRVCRQDDDDDFVYEIAEAGKWALCIINDVVIFVRAVCSWNSVDHLRAFDIRFDASNTYEMFVFRTSGLLLDINQNILQVMGIEMD